MQTKNQIFKYSGVVLFFLLSSICLGILAVHPSGAELNTPWQAISSVYIYFFFALTVIVGLLIYTELPIWLKLTLLSVYSLVLHSYLPLTHPLLYGADGWRHLAEINRILAGLPWREAATNGSVGFLSWLGTISYTGMWWLVIALAKFICFAPIDILRWLAPIAWSIYGIPVFYYFVKSFKVDDTLALVIVWLASFPYAIQVVGAFTLPVNLWAIVWLGAMGLLINEYNQDKIRWGWLVLIQVIMLCGYSLYAMLFALSWIVLALLRHSDLSARKIPLAFLKSFLPEDRREDLKQVFSGQNSLEKIAERASDKLSWIWLIICSIGTAAVIVAAELFTRVSSLPKHINIISALKQFIGNLSGWFLVSGPRPHDIATGNIFFNQVPSLAFVSNFLTSWRAWILVFMVIIFVGFVWGAYLALKSNSLTRRFTGVFALGLFIAYFVGRYILVGQQLITRRLDFALAVFALILIVFAKEKIFAWVSKRGKLLILTIILFTLIDSIAIAASYSLGPDEKTVSVNQYLAMQKIAIAEKDKTSHCVIADTYPLLVLEALSNKQIVGGGFPIDSTFAQTERVKLYNYLVKNPAGQKPPNTLQLLKEKGSCWFVGPTNQVINISL